MRVVALPRVYRPRSDTALLAAALRLQTISPRARILDMCTGTGALALEATRHARDVTAVDIQRRAVLNARLNARLNRVPIAVHQGDLFESLDGARFDAIVSNPPYVPAPEGIGHAPGDRAWNAGPDGRWVLDRLCADAAAHLRPGGFVLIVQSSVAGVAETIERLADTGLDPSTVSRRRGAFGPIMSERAPLLVERGVLGPGAREEEIVVVCGRRPRVRAAPVVAPVEAEAAA
jgi:release factor glutamine methyltransferase